MTRRAPKSGLKLILARDREPQLRLWLWRAVATGAAASATTLKGVQFA